MSGFADRLAQALRQKRHTTGEREGKRWTQDDLADAIGVARNTVSAWLNRGVEPRDTAVIADVARALDVSADWLLGVTGELRASLHGSATLGADLRVGSDFAPNPRYRAEIPPRAYQIGRDYLARLERAGVPAEDLEEAERLLFDSRYAKLNKRDRTELSEEDHILLIEAGWDIIREVLSWQGIRP